MNTDFGIITMWVVKGYLSDFPVSLYKTIRYHMPTQVLLQLRATSKEGRTFLFLALHGDLLEVGM
jgi:hypothetical protein